MRREKVAIHVPTAAAGAGSKNTAAPIMVTTTAVSHWSGGASGNIVYIANQEAADNPATSAIWYFHK